jgi:Protein of unknown function (DUF3137)
MKSQIRAIGFIVLADLIIAQTAFARGGGGGSGGGGGGGGGGFGGGHGGSGGGSLPWWMNLIIILIFLAFALFGNYFKNRFLKQREAKEEAILEAEHIDAAAIKERVKDIFYKFEEAWSKFDLMAMKSLLTDEYYKRMVLELNVLQNEKRQDLMNEVSLTQALIYDVGGDSGSQSDSVTVRISASAQDKLMDTETNQQLFYDPSPFVEYWHLVKEDGDWKLHLITQETEEPDLVENDIAAFAGKNGFFFDPDFGWLMMPNKGVLFSKTNFGTSDINNHVIGYFRDKIVEFYTYIPKPNANYLVAQAVLPKSYRDILIKKKHLLELPKWGLRKAVLESADFNKKFNVWADPADQVNSLELLTPNFMEKIYNLPFELNIELVGNFLYFYAKDRGQADYDKMLEILSWAFDEMKM